MKAKTLSLAHKIEHSKPHSVHPKPQTPFKPQNDNQQWHPYMFPTLSIVVGEACPPVGSEVYFHNPAAEATIHHRVLCFGHQEGEGDSGIWAHRSREEPAGSGAR